MDIFSILCLADTAISLANGFIALYKNIAPSKESRDKNIFTHNDGRRYEGSVPQGTAHGKGTLIFPDGTRCEGEFEHGQLKGNIVIIWADGRRSDGAWRENRFVPETVCREIRVQDPFSQRTEKISIHVALSTQEPFVLEYFGDTSQSLFDKWFCYQQAFEWATQYHTLNVDRILEKLSYLEAEPAFPKVFFETIATTYEEIVAYCQKTKPESLTAAMLTTYLETVHDNRQTLQACGQSATFLSPLEQYLQELLTRLLETLPNLRGQHIHHIHRSKKYLSQRLHLKWEGSSQEFLLLVKKQISIGRGDQHGSESDIWVLDTNDIEQPTYISRNHAILEYTPHGFQVMPDKSRYDVWIERRGQIILVTQPTLLDHEDALRLGKRAANAGVTLRYVAYYDENDAGIEQQFDNNATVDDGSVGRSLRAAKIEIQHGYSKIRTTILPVSACSIGRDISHPLCISDNRVSRNHAMLTHKDNGFWIADTGSRNGTFVNDARCLEPMPLLSGDLIRLGEYIKIKVS